MKKLILAIPLVFALTLLSSCYVTKVDIGNYKTTQAHEYKLNKYRDVYLFWGLAKLGNPNPITATPCQIRSKFGFWDVIISSLTGGLISTRTTVVRCKDEKNK